jgi:hypothetical protein
VKALLFALLLAAGCKDPKLARALAEIDQKIAAADAQGTQRGALLEKRGTILEKLGRRAEAADSFEAAAAAYNQSPEGSNMPVLRANHAREQAERLRRH